MNYFVFVSGGRWEKNLTQNTFIHKGTYIVYIFIYKILKFFLIVSEYYYYTVYIYCITQLLA